MKRNQLRLSEREELKKLVDNLAVVKAQRKAYELREKLLLEQLKRHGVGLFEGTFFNAETIRTWNLETDWDGLYLAHRRVQKWVADFTRQVPSLVTRIKPRITETLEIVQ